MPVANYDDILARYKRMRNISRKLNKVLPDYVPKEGLEAVGRKLGLWEQGTLVFDSEDHVCVLMDQAIHGCFRDGKNAVDCYAAEHPPKPGSDEEVLLAAMRRAFYSLFRVEEVVGGVGTRVMDILQNRESFMADVNFSRSAVAGQILASRVVSFEEFIMTTGVALPAAPDAVKEGAGYVKKMAKARQNEPGMTREENAEMAAELTKLCLASAVTPSIEYREIDEAPDDRVIPLRREAGVGRNDPCPCGSGKKYKKCCGQ
jgi:hypothetical protein